MDESPANGPQGRHRNKIDRISERLVAQVAEWIRHEKTKRETRKRIRVLRRRKTPPIHVNGEPTSKPPRLSSHSTGLHSDLTMNGRSPNESSERPLFQIFPTPKPAFSIFISDIFPLHSHPPESGPSSLRRTGQIPVCRPSCRPRHLTSNQVADINGA
ncbi:hypothetical protein QBC45DRAFT_5136 [Copromyces sp. CBS 386.78]|nr:hypothetical protein QBC45DRAFT_5136 [Copromyces sp. CBS 386.78]